MSMHRFEIGQTVRFAGATALAAAQMQSGDFRVVALLPEYQGSLQYRLESANDGHQRVATEAELLGF